MRKISAVFDELVGDDPQGFNVVEYILVETTTDAYRVLSDGWSLTRYIQQYGDVEVEDVEVEYDNQYRVYCVPAFADEIESYCQAKAEDCARWSCE